MEHEPASTDMMSTLLADPTTWTGTALVIFLLIALIFLKPQKAVAKSLDDRAAKIRSELDNAEALRKEAEAKLADAERRQIEAEQSAKAIIDSAAREAEQFSRDQTAALAERIKLREKLAEERIARAESEAVRDVRNAAADAAAKAAAVILSDTLTGKAADDHFTASLEKVTKALS